MRFANPQALWLLLPVACALLLQIRSAWRRSADLARFAREETLPSLVPPPDRSRDVIRNVLRYGALLLCVAALLRPQGEPVREARKGEGLDIIIALDTSRSMLADDLRPSRLTVAKGAIERLTASLRGDRIGLLLFSGTSFLACPLTTDYGAVIEVLRQVTTETLPRGGTSLAAALEGGVRGFKGINGTSRVLILISDGEEHEGEARNAAQALRSAGITLVAAGAGSPGGALIPQSGGYLQDREGHVVRSALNTASLGAVAEAAGGTVVTLDGLDALARLYGERLSTMPKRETVTGVRRQYREWFHIPLGGACLLLLLELLIPVRRRS